MDSKWQDNLDKIDEKIDAVLNSIGVEELTEWPAVVGDSLKNLKLLYEIRTLAAVVAQLGEGI